MKAADRFDPEAQEELRRTISEAGGNEVFSVAEIDETGQIRRLRTAARGNHYSVPALKPYLEQSDVVLHNHPSGELTPSAADLRIASELGNEGIGFFIVDNLVERVYVVAEPIVPRERVDLDADLLAAFLEPGGGLAAVFSGYEERREQVDMLRLVCGSFNSDSLCVVEAGTGVGKSLAYLIPALEWAGKNGERVVISTATINLQHQLLDNDIPLVCRLLDTDVRAVLVKGRSNYLCRNRLRESFEELALMQEKDEELASIRGWAESTDTGCVSDLSFLPSPEVWAQVCSEADSCLGLRCSFREECFVLRARREAAAARINVVNHHLLFSDLAVRLSGIGFDGSAVLPPFHRIIFDEAHHLESSATSFFTQAYSRFTLMKYLGRLSRIRGGRRGGLLHVLLRLLPAEAGRRAEKLPGLTDALRDRAAVFDSFCLGLLNERGNLLVRPRSGPQETADGGDSDGLLSPDVIRASVSELEGALLEYCRLLQNAVESLEQEDAAFSCRIVLRRLEELAGVMNRFARPELHPEEIFWIERIRGVRGEPACRLAITPLSVGSIMREAVFGRYSSITFTSATLTVGGSFRYWKSRIGLDEEVMEGKFESPFNYGRNVLLGVPVDSPLPPEAEYEGFVASFTGEVLRISEGRALVLFTAYSMLNRMYEQIQPELCREGINILKQGDDDRRRLLCRFRRDRASVLFATDSFWEGVDTPGDALEVLIVCRLPFRVPSDPVFRARTEAVERRGGSSFMELSLPDAVIRLKQGFGRLMRRRDDIGVVLILDSRIVKRWYGRHLLDSLPPCARKITEAHLLLEAVERFLIDRRRSRLDEKGTQD